MALEDTSTVDLAMTALQVQDRLLTTVVNIADEYSVDDDLSTSEKCHGVAFAVLAALDGTRDLPPMDIITRTPPAAVAVSIEEGEEYIPPGIVVNEGYAMHKRYAAIRKEVAGGLTDSESETDPEFTADDEIPF